MEFTVFCDTGQSCHVIFSVQDLAGSGRLSVFGSAVGQFHRIGLCEQLQLGLYLQFEIPTYMKAAEQYNGIPRSSVICKPLHKTTTPTK